MHFAQKLLSKRRLMFFQRGTYGLVEWVSKQVATDFLLPSTCRVVKAKCSKCYRVKKQIEPFHIHPLSMNTLNS